MRAERGGKNNGWWVGFKPAAATTTYPLFGNVNNVPRLTEFRLETALHLFSIAIFNSFKPFRAFCTLNQKKRNRALFQSYLLQQYSGDARINLFID